MTPREMADSTAASDWAFWPLAGVVRVRVPLGKPIRFTIDVAVQERNAYMADLNARLSDRPLQRPPVRTDTALRALQAAAPDGGA